MDVSQEETLLHPVLLVPIESQPGLRHAVRIANVVAMLLGLLALTAFLS